MVGRPNGKKREGNESQAKDKAYYYLNANGRQGKTCINFLSWLVEDLEHYCCFPWPFGCSNGEPSESKKKEKKRNGEIE